MVCGIFASNSIIIDFFWLNSIHTEPKRTKTGEFLRGKQWATVRIKCSDIIMPLQPSVILTPLSILPRTALKIKWYKTNMKNLISKIRRSVLFGGVLIQTLFGQISIQLPSMKIYSEGHPHNQTFPPNTFDMLIIK